MHRQVCLPDGSSRVLFANGDIKWVLPAPDGPVHYYYAQVGVRLYALVHAHAPACVCMLSLWVDGWVGYSRGQGGTAGAQTTSQ